MRASMPADVPGTAPTQTHRYEHGLEVQVYYLGCLAQASYLVIDNSSKSAYAVDPRRDVDVYLEAAKTAGVEFQGVLETHVHADFVSGHVELAERAGVPVYIGPAPAEYAHTTLTGGEQFPLSAHYEFRAVHTPGHTTACVTYVLHDLSACKDVAAFTGDTLFIGSVGRSDLLGSFGRTQQEMAELMYATLHDKILALGDHVVVYPGHGAGSPCGKGLSSDLSSTIGKERGTNPGLLKAALDTSDQFVAWTCEGQPGVPQYFISNVEMNIKGAPSLVDQVAQVERLTPERFAELAAQPDTVILDTRYPADMQVWLPDALCIPIGEGWGTHISGPEDGNFALWVGTLIPPGTAMLVVAPDAKETVVLSRLGRIGYTQSVRGFLEGGAEAWAAAGLPTEPAVRVSPSELQEFDGVVVDVRTPGEFVCTKRGHLTSAVNISLGTGLTNAESDVQELKLDKSRRYATYCISGFRSCIAASLLRRGGLAATDIVGGINGVLENAPNLVSNYTGV